MAGRSMLLVATLGVLLSGSVFAQDVANGTITGVAKDTSGAVLPGVTVEAASPALIEGSRTAVTDSEGRYRIGALRPGVYTLTFGLAGFRGVRREGVELTTGFTATVNADLGVSAIQETITVTGETPVVDIKNSSQQAVLSGELVRSLPLGKNNGAYVTLLPGAVQSNLQNIDVGGTKGETEGQFAIHGGHPNDGYRFREGLYDGSLTCNFGSNPFSTINPATIQEVNIQLTGGLTAEAPTGGTQTNIVLRDGGNNFNGTLQFDTSTKGLQSNNVDSELAARGVGARPSIKELYDVSSGFGGPLVKNKVWFFADARKWQALSYLPGNYFNLQNGSLFYQPDLSRPAYNGTRSTSGGLRLTWQASAKDKITATGTYDENNDPFFNLQNAANSPEAAQNDVYKPIKFGIVSWTRPFTNRLLMQLGVLKVGGGIQFLSTNNDLSILDNSKNYRYGSPTNNVSRQFSQANFTGTLSYVTGGHTLRVGGTYMDGFRNEYTYQSNGANLSYTFAGIVPQSVTYYAYPLDYAVDLRISDLFAQDQWTLSNLTLNLGVRYDRLRGSSPASSSPAGTWVPARAFGAVDDSPLWNDIQPRLGFAYNLFGDGKTVIKGSLGRFVPLETNNGTAAQANPAAATVVTASRTWRDANGDYIPQASELGPLSPAAFGQSVPNTRLDPSVLTGFEVRPYSWQGGVSVQRELRTGLAVNVGYFRTWYGNFLTTDNLMIAPTDYQSYCVNGPSNASLPNGGGERICGILDVSPAKFGRSDNLVTHASDYGKQTEVYNGLDFTVLARFGHGGLLTGGLATAQTVTNNCEIVAALPELLGANPAPSRFCDVRPPWSAATQLKVSGSYTLPWDVRLAGVYQNIPGFPTTATFVTNTATSPEIVAQLGRQLSSGANGTSSIELVAPQSQFLDGRISMLSLNVAKTVRLGKTRIEPRIDVFNALNGNGVELAVVRYGTAWRNVTGILPARMVKLGVRLDF